MTDPLGAACNEIFRTMEILGPDRLRIGDRVSVHDPDLLLGVAQAEIYLRFYACLREGAPGMLPDVFLDALRRENRSNQPRRESLAGLPQSYVALGLPSPPGTRWLRLYWNVGPHGAVALMGKLTDRLSRDSVPYRLKIMLNTAYRRRDAAVLYTPAECWPKVAALIDTCRGHVADAGDLEPETPLFTRALRPGIGLAEDPGGAHSFGTHRSGLVAFTLARIHLSGLVEQPDQWRALQSLFKSFGLDLARPHLNRRGPDPYAT